MPAARASLLADLQSDFCAGGTLAVPQGDSMIDIANHLIDWCAVRGDTVVVSLDWCLANHGGFTSQHQVESYSQRRLDSLAQAFWSDHRVQNGEGVALHPLLNQHAISQTFTKGENPLVDSYSAFFDNGRRRATVLNTWLLEHRIAELTIMGLTTNHCVKLTVLDALDLGYTVSVITDGCRGVNIQSQDSASAFMEMATTGTMLYALDGWLETQP